MDNKIAVKDKTTNTQPMTFLIVAAFLLAIGFSKFKQHLIPMTNMEIIEIDKTPLILTSKLKSIFAKVKIFDKIDQVTPAIANVINKLMNIQ